MYSQFVFLLLAISIIKEAEMFKTNDFCFITEKHCIGKFGLNKVYKTECKKTKCKGVLSFQCGTDHCSKNESTCVKLLRFNQMFKVYLKTSISYYNALKEYNDFHKIIRNCTQTPYEWNSNDVCLNGKNCFFTHLNSMSLSGKMKVNIPINCVCQNKYSYRCSKEFCTISKRACDELNSLLVKGKKLSLKHCGNGNRKI